MKPRWLRNTYPDYQGQIAFSTTISSRDPRYRESTELHQHLKLMLAEHDIQLYSHQAAAIDSFLQGDDVCVTTSTASGKTLAYALSIAHHIHCNPEATALLVYPTKALTRDQQQALDDIYTLLDMDVTIGIYDGDVTSTAKRKVRQHADLILTNFTGLNLYLKHHQKWSQFYEHLQTVVIDEAHYYTGLHGIHVAWIIRRLRRVIQHYSSDPQFMLSSATLGNPSEHAEHLVGKPFTVIDEDGSERGSRHLVIWNPPKLHENIGERVSTHRESSRLLAHLVAHGMQTLMFAPSRKMTELDSLWATEQLQNQYKAGRATVKPYNAGHAKTERRQTERMLRGMEVDGVVSTTALELGIDIGSMDATLLSGYPGTRISFWQQIGRSGRGSDTALSVLVPFNSALDQYIVHHPGYLLGEAIEDAVVDLSNNKLFSQHLLAAADELPLTRDDIAFFGEKMQPAAEMWRQEGSLAGDIQRGYRYVRNDFVQSKINLYAMSTDRFDVQIRTADGGIETLPAIDRTRAYRDFHEGAIYLHQGEYYQVVELDRGSSPRVVLEPVDTDYYTVTLRETAIEDIEKTDERQVGELKACRGTGTVTIHYYGYKKKRMMDDAVVGTEDTDLEPISINTQVCWIEISEGVKDELLELAEQKLMDGVWELRDDWSSRMEATMYHYHGALHAVEHSLIHMLPLLMLIDEKDVGGISTSLHPEIGCGAVFIYDGIDGGVGFAHDAYKRIGGLAEKARQRLDECSCQGVRGCPACTFSADCGNDNDPLNRPLAVTALDRIV